LKLNTVVLNDCRRRNYRTLTKEKKDEHADNIRGKIKGDLIPLQAKHGPVGI